MNRWKKGVLAVALLGVAGCIPSQRQLRTEQDLEEMKRRLAQAERSVVALRQDRSDRASERLEELARQQADLQAGLDALRVEFQSVNGRLEDMSRERAGIRDDLALIQDDMGLKVAALEDRLDQLESAAAAEPAEPPPAEPAVLPEARYQKGLELIQKQGDFAAGRREMEGFVKENPGHELAVNAAYWVGEAYYGEKQYENAILQFQEVIEKHPAHTKAAAALLKQGLAFRALGDERNARTILQKVVDTYPDSEEAKKARERLAEWEKGN